MSKGMYTAANFSTGFCQGASMLNQVDTYCA